MLDTDFSTPVAHDTIATKAAAAATDYAIAPPPWSKISVFNFPREGLLRPSVGRMGNWNYQLNGLCPEQEILM